MIPEDVVEIMKTLISNNYQAFLVGGCVRDILLGIEPHDYDIATNATPQQVVELFSSQGFRVIPKGIQYGVVSVLTRIGREVEIATFRREYYAIQFDRKSATVTFSESLADDVARRDFTINALAMDVNGNIIDLVGGLQDLRSGIIRFIGNADERIREDPLRMIRALRFAARFGYTIDQQSFNAIRRNRELVKYLSPERIRDEIIKASSKNFARFIELMYSSGLLEIVLPEVHALASIPAPSHHPAHMGETNMLHHTLNVLARLDAANANYLVKLAGLFHDIGYPMARVEKDGRVMYPQHEEHSARIAEEVMRRLRFSNAEIAVVTFLVRNHMRLMNITPRVLANLAYDIVMFSRRVNREPREIANMLMTLIQADDPHRDLSGTRNILIAATSIPLPNVQQYVGRVPPNEMENLRRSIFVQRAIKVVQ